MASSGTPQRHSEDSTLNGSPASTLDSGSPASGSNHRPLHESSRLSLRSVYAGSTSFSGAGTPITRKSVIRSDPSLLTSFDPADKELYDLWVPKD
ncbi:hypothetical protein Moror_7406 [Moniliophthora roreri MCA 2997]|uniref:Uncharacterized protein n=2 Tax=Moniliophthora roreri TaxID=221103 RepID=V2XT74_MONRO|nr:hypothetical protein Moror_7406 [Moniliophthora roreri MCA 2997]KAI3612131.1 hypothetical protein WG66_012175 [Moniliophthora roreri]